MHHHSPHLECITSLHTKHWEFLIGRTQFDIPLTLMRKVKIFDSKLPVPESHHYRPAMRLHSPVDYHPVAVEYSCVLHRVTRYIPEERCLGMADKVAVEVEPLVLIVVGGRRKSRHHCRMFQFESRGEVSPYYSYISHNIRYLGCEVATCQSPIVRRSGSKLMPTFTMGRPERANFEE